MDDQQLECYLVCYGRDSWSWRNFDLFPSEGASLTIEALVGEVRRLRAEIERITGDNKC